MLSSDEIDYVRRQLNAKLFLDAIPWMLPSWAVLALKDIDREASMITELQNDMYLNWSLIGGVGAKHYGIADSRGLVSPRIDTGSIDFWLVDRNELVFPALMGKDESQLKLVSSEDQVYEWKNHMQSVEFTRLVYHVTKNGSEYVYNEIALRNHGLESVDFSFYALVRPISVLGIEPIELAEYDSDKMAVYINGLLGMVSDLKPSAVCFSEFDDAELPERIKNEPADQEFHYTSDAGLATVLLKYDVTLRPAGSQQIFFWSPLSPVSKSDELPQVKPESQDRDTSIGEWFAFSDNRASVLFPDEQLDMVFSQAAVSIAMQAFPVMFPKDPEIASLNWKDRIRILLALLKSGALDVAEKAVGELKENLNVVEGQLDLSIFGPLLWGLHQYHEYTQGSTLNEDKLRFLKKLTAGVVESIKIQIASTTSELEEGNSSQEDEELLKHRIIIRPGVISNLDSMLWNYAALISARSTISPLYEEELIVSLNQTIEQYHSHILSACSEVEQGRWLREEDSSREQVEDEIVHLLGTTALLQRYGIDTDFVEYLYNKLSSKRMVKSLWKSYHPSERYSSYLALRVAQYLAVTQRRNQVETFLGRAVEFLSDDYHLPEFVNPRTFGGSGGAGLSVLASADLILLLYDMLVHEREDCITVLAGIPEEWFTSKKPLIIDGLPLTRGDAHIEIGMSANQYQIEVGMDALPEEIEIHVPPSVPMPMVKAYGGSIVERTSKVTSPFLKVVPLSDQVVLTYHK
jgi:hypothetical protein